VWNLFPALAAFKTNSSGKAGRRAELLKEVQEKREVRKPTFAG
jgi:hypothetical protein